MIYHIHAHNVSLYEMKVIPPAIDKNNLQQYVQLFHRYRGRLCYSVTCQDGYTIEYLPAKELQEESYSIKVVGNIHEYNASPLLGEPLYIEDNMHNYICIYHLDRGNIYKSGQLINFIGFGKSCLDRAKGDQLAHMYLSEKTNMYEQHKEHTTIYHVR